MTDLVRLFLQEGTVYLAVSMRLLLVVILAAAAIYFVGRRWRAWWIKEFEVDEAEFGIGNQRIVLRRNRETVQVAYKLWVELSTRKIGLPIDFDNDVIIEVYDSWYEFFKVTRELLKDLPASRFRSDPSTERLVGLAIDVLNEGLRPHLTTWQARFRQWYDRQATASSSEGEDPQELQRRYPRWEQLKQDMQAVNHKLVAYRRTMRQVVFD